MSPPLVVLCADDSPIIHRIVRAFLVRAGHRVDVAGSGAEAVALVEAGAYDVVLMDVEMPEMDGFTATRRIRQSEQRTGGHLPIVALTAHALPVDQARCLEAGMDACLTKPFTAADLTAVIAAVLPRAGASDSGVATHTTLRVDEEVRGLLVSEYESAIEEIDRAMEDGRLGEVRALVHRLKGAMALFHTGEPYAAADRLELAAAAEDPDAGRAAWRDLTAHLEKLLRDLRA